MDDANPDLNFQKEQKITSQSCGHKISNQKSGSFSSFSAAMRARSNSNDGTRTVFDNTLRSKNLEISRLNDQLNELKLSLERKDLDLKSIKENMSETKMNNKPAKKVPQHNWTKIRQQARAQENSALRHIQTWNGSSIGQIIAKNQHKLSNEENSLNSEEPHSTPSQDSELNKENIKIETKQNEGKKTVNMEENLKTESESEKKIETEDKKEETLKSREPLKKTSKWLSFGNKTSDLTKKVLELKKQKEEEELKANLPETYIEFLKKGQSELTMNSVVSFKANFYDSENYEWFLRFFALKGLQYLISAIESYEELETLELSQLVCQTNLVLCFKMLMNNKVGLEQVIEKEQSCIIDLMKISKKSPNIMMKTQVRSLLAAIALYSEDGYKIVMNGINVIFGNKEKNQRFSWIINSLINEEDTNFRISTLSLINSLVICPDLIEDRINLRRELSDLNFNEWIDQLLETPSDSRDEELSNLAQVYLDEFESDKKDYEGIRENIGIDITDPLSIFNAVRDNIRYEKNSRESFLNVLQNLLLIPSNNQGELVWKLLEKISHKCVSLDKSKNLESDFQKASLLEIEKSVLKNKEILKIQQEKEEDDNKLPKKIIKSISKENIDKEISKKTEEDQKSKSNSISQTETIEKSEPPNTEIKAPPKSSGPPPPAAPLMGGPPPPPAPGMGGPPPPPGMGGPPPPPGMGGASQVGPGGRPFKLPLKPSIKMRPLYWTKINNNAVVKTVWIQGEIDDTKIEYEKEELETYFPAVDPNKAKRELEKQAKENKEDNKPKIIQILDTKRSNNVNIVLFQFKEITHQEIKERILTVSDNLSTEQLENLLKYVPDSDEISQIQAYEGDKELLGNAEKFFLILSEIPNLSEKLKFEIFKNEFDSKLAQVSSDIQLIEEAFLAVRNQNSKFHSILEIILSFGNYVNGGTPRGAAYGVNIDVLKKITEMKSTIKPRISMLHYIISYCEKNKPEILEFPNEFQCIEKSTSVSVQNLQTDFNSIQKSLAELGKSLEKNDSETYHTIMTQFFEKCTMEVESVTKDFQNLENLMEKTFIEFGDLPTKSKDPNEIESFLKFLNSFSDNFQRAILDNKKEAELAKKALERQKILDQKKEAQKKNQNLTKEEEGVMDDLFDNIKVGNFKNRRRRGLRAKNNSENSNEKTAEDLFSTLQ